MLNGLATLTGLDGPMLKGESNSGLLRWVRAQNLAKLWRDIGESYLVINSPEDMEVFLLIGGNGLVEKSVAEAVVPEFLGPQEAVQTGFSGFENFNSLPKEAFNRAPTPKQRMQILKRDNYRCKICGRRAVDYVDVELHVHHIRPWAKGGVTVNENLITLCHTCHKGLDLHFEIGLFGLVSPSGKLIDTEQERKEYLEGIRRYREKVVQEYSSKTFIKK